MALRTARKTNGAVPASQPRVLLASAEKIDPSDRGQAAKMRRLRQNWQDDVWEQYDAEPTVSFPHRYIGNSLSHIRPYAAWRPDPNAEPVPFDPDDEDQIKNGVATIGQAAQDAMDRLSGPLGSAGQIMGQLGMHLGLVGEGFLYGAPDADSLTGETWEVLSTQELKVQGEEWRIYRDESDRQGEPVPADAFVLRVWRPHPKFRSRADAPMRALVETADALILMERAVKSLASSRVTAGFLKVPQELSFPQRTTDPSDGQGQDDPFMRDIIDVFLTPVRDPTAASAIAPIPVRGPAEALKEFGLLPVQRPIDETFIKLRQEARQTMGIGIDLPMEVLLGMSTANHWGAWQIDEQVFKAHLEPIVIAVCSALTSGFLRPDLKLASAMRQAFSVDLIRQVVCWYDASELIGDPDNFDRAIIAHKEFAISDKTLRHAGGWGDADAPDTEEILRRIDQTRGRPQITGPGLDNPVADPLNESTGDGPPGTQSQTPRSEPPMPSAGTPPSPARPAARTASAARPVPDLGRKLQDIDRSLTLRVHAWAEAAVRRMLEVAAGRARKQLGAKNRQVAELAKGRDMLSFLAEQGRTPMLRAGLAEADLFDDNLDDLHGRYETATRRAYLAALALAAKASGRKLSGSQLEQFEQRQAAQIDAGWTVLAAGIAAAARELLFNPAPVPPPVGEHDAMALVQPGLVRDALAVAGGAGATTEAKAGPATGTLMLGTLETDLGIGLVGYQWEHGDPDRDFEPHLDLDGQEFTSWDDAVLVNSGTFPDSDHFYPGDHNGCQCLYVPVFATPGEE